MRTEGSSRAVESYLIDKETQRSFIYGTIRVDKLTPFLARTQHDCFFLLEYVADQLT
jgi:hypothetical protein